MGGQQSTLRRYWKTLVAVLGGNFLYFVVLYPYLPAALRYRPYRVLDWGLLLDFGICVALYGVLHIAIARRK